MCCCVDQDETFEWRCRGEHSEVPSSLYYTGSEEGELMARVCVCTTVLDVYIGSVG